MPDPTRRTFLAGPYWLAYGALIAISSAFYYGVISRLKGSDEGGLKWFWRRLKPVLPLLAPGQATIWIHAVSAGEGKIAERLRERLVALDPGVSVVLSATTYSGHKRTRAAAGDGAAFIMPIDTLGAQRRIVRALRPDLVVLVESEFWPAQFAALGQAGVPVVVVNATLSARSVARHRRWPMIAHATLGRAARIYVQSEQMRQNFEQLGVAPKQLEICGNLKLATARFPQGRKTGRETVTFGNIHAAEIGVLAGVVSALRATRPGLRIILVPRYPGATDLRDVRLRFGPSLSLVSSLDGLDDAGDMVWINAMGILSALYSRSAIGVVCGTFAPIGGHDLAEPLQQGAATIYGPHVGRQQPLHAALTGAAIARQVESAGSLVAMIIALLDSPDDRAMIVRRFRDLAAGANSTLERIAADLLSAANAHHRQISGDQSIGGHGS